MSRYAMRGRVSGELLTYRGKLLIHGSREEMEWLFPGTQVIRVSDGDLGQPVLPLSMHPGLVEVGITFPLRREDFL